MATTGDGFPTTQEGARLCMQDAKWMNDNVSQPATIVHLIVRSDRAAFFVYGC